MNSFTFYDFVTKLQFKRTLKTSLRVGGRGWLSNTGMTNEMSVNKKKRTDRVSWVLVCGCT